MTKIKLLFLLTFFVLFMGCELYTSHYIDNHFSKKLEGMELYEDYRSFDSYYPWMDDRYDIAYWLMNNVEYFYEVEDDWQSPKFTLEEGYGDCEDYSLAFINMAYYELGIKMDIVCIDDTQSRSIVRGGLDVTHVTVSYQNEIIDVYTGMSLGTLEEVNVKYIYTFDEIFN
jgi:hypothetical protein